MTRTDCHKYTQLPAKLFSKTPRSLHAIEKTPTGDEWHAMKHQVDADDQIEQGRHCHNDRLLEEPSIISGHEGNETDPEPPQRRKSIHLEHTSPDGEPTQPYKLSQQMSQGLSQQNHPRLQEDQHLLPPPRELQCRERRIERSQSLKQCTVGFLKNEVLSI